MRGVLFVECFELAELASELVKVGLEPDFKRGAVRALGALEGCDFMRQG